MDIQLENSDLIQDLLEARLREFNQNAQTVCTGLMMQVLRSIRARTLKAVPTKAAKNEIKVELASGYHVGYKRAAGSKGKKISTRVLRDSAGHEITGKKVFWKVSNYAYHEQYYVYKVTDEILPDGYFLVCDNQALAKKLAYNLKKSKVARHEGLAKTALGLAMNKVSKTNSGNQSISGDAQTVSVADNLTSGWANVQKVGLNSTEVNMGAHVKTDYAILALYNKESTVQESIIKAMKSIAGYIRKHTQNKTIYDKMNITLNELKALEGNL